MTEKILFLGYGENQIIDFLRERGYSMVLEDKKIDLKKMEEISPDYTVSYGYTHIIKPDVIEKFSPILNLHISFLPWNMGVSPNFWSWLENTPSGFTIYHIDPFIDTGPILIQERAEHLFGEDETLRTSYSKSRHGIEKMFINSWEEILSGKIVPKEQNKEEGSHHYGRELERYSFLMEKGWDTGVKSIRDYGRRNGLWIFDEKGEKIK